MSRFGHEYINGKDGAIRLNERFSKTGYVYLGASFESSTFIRKSEKFEFWSRKNWWISCYVMGDTFLSIFDDEFLTYFRTHCVTFGQRTSWSYVTLCWRLYWNLSLCFALVFGLHSALLPLMVPPNLQSIQRWQFHQLHVLLLCLLFPNDRQLFPNVDWAGVRWTDHGVPRSQWRSIWWPNFHGNFVDHWRGWIWHPYIGGFLRFDTSKNLYYSNNDNG